jgi:hypothetical protein
MEVAELEGVHFGLAGVRLRTASPYLNPAARECSSAAERQLRRDSGVDKALNVVPVGETADIEIG